MPKYVYSGPVMCFETCIQKKWTGKTYADSEKKARSNLAYQYKKENGMLPNKQISLTGELNQVYERSNLYGRNISTK